MFKSLYLFLVIVITFWNHVSFSEMEQMDNWEVEIKEEAESVHPDMDFIEEENFFPFGHWMHETKDIVDIVDFTSKNMCNISNKANDVLRQKAKNKFEWPEKNL